MIREFLYKYYIDPIRYGQAYTLVDTLTYALILIVAVYLLYRGLRRYRIAVDDELVLATLPFVVLGGLLRVVEDTGMITSDLRFLLITPLIFFTIFAVAAVALFAGKLAENAGLVSRYSRVYGGAGIVACLLAGAALVWFGLAETTIALDVLVTILALALVSSLAFWAFLVYVLKWDYASNILYKLLIFGHMLDASATSYGIDIHPVHYVEQHVVGSSLIELTGTAFSMFLLKIAVLVPAIYVLEMYRREGNPELWHLILLAMIVVGMAPGIRDLVRMVLYV
ncbi:MULTISPECIES: DUF63 family protein [unclassified Methanoculleus]|uniref:DUF63 family protein n=1 Tax=unclassified Methanoculleus TaxID=2619537 RepID=UPI0025E92181|nr:MULTISPECIES: DUF63 family protein [unclassified Methanoculleus]MCK9317651.1 DUF63 family protein [Methanoculleus sp.]MDD2253535.1 DUF63 family protein [Methanoculleus sp.]MDD2786508.1 DUF63 family protein [Methanoculleus sp.]MDD3215643.1 DUF63 family protein [Methanoculleus sp.]MDD4313437.1 DUF63 family protein [Methanoculleus sp.]